MKIVKLAIISITLAVASFAFAGAVQSVPVLITLNEGGSGSGDAHGNMLNARFSDNDVEFIGCGTRAIDAGTVIFDFGFCQASDSEGNRAFCSTDDPLLLDAMRATADYSFVTFSFSADAACTRIGFSTQSLYIPSDVQKKPKKGKK